MHFPVPDSTPDDLKVKPVALPGHHETESRDAAHHGARDVRQAARDHSERERSRRAVSAPGGRSYAFRRS